MGRVYEALDTNLKRRVALKVLPDVVATDTGRLARFQREAEVLARLNHPNIAQIYGLERSADTTALVMELVDSETMADRVARGPMPVDEALPIARQIADALEAAHEQGIIHRDLKPANIKVRPDGTVKVLDFGLAKALEPQAALSAGLSLSPTITTPAHTQAGLILGTAAYMAPEQAKGRPADARADVWAFGAVLFEMLSGQRPFDGEDTTEVLGAVVRLEPKWNLLPPQVPSRISQVLRACLQKDRKQRLAHVQDVRLALDGAFDTTTAVAGSVPPAPRATWRRLTPIAAAAVVGAALVGLVRRSPEAPRAGVVRFSHVLPAGVGFRNAGRTVLAVSPDGRRIVYNTTSGLYVRAMEESEGRLLPDTEEPLANPFFSPDGATVGYFQAGQLKRLALTGGEPMALAPASNPLGITWAADDTIFVAQPEGIMRVPGSGGTPDLIVRGDGSEAISGVQLLPDNDSLLFSITSSSASASGSNRWDSAQIVVQSIRSGARKVLPITGSDARYVATGHVLYAFKTTLYTVRLDLKALEVRDTPIPIVQGISKSQASGSAHYDVSRDGTLFYAAAVAAAVPSSLAWIDRTGKAETIASIRPGIFDTPRLSADGRSVLVVAQGDLRVYDLATGREIRLTSDGGTGAYAEWRPDGGTVAYSSFRAGQSGGMNVWVQPADGTGQATQLTTLNGNVHVDSWTPDGRTLALHQHKPDGNADAFTIEAAGGAGAKLQPLLTERFVEQHVVFSPDRRYIAYQSDETGKPEVFIRPFPGPGPKTPVSVGGGDEIAWTRSGELFFRRLEDSAIISVAVRTTPTLSIGRSTELFRLVPGPPVGARRYAVTDDGKRFLMGANLLRSTSEASATRPMIQIAVNWDQELTRAVPGR